MDGRVKIKGLEDAMAAMQAAFPNNPKQARKLLNQGMSASAKATIVPSAKRRALRGDGSGALSEAIGVRSQSMRKSLSKGRAAGVEVVPVRSNRKAMAIYINHYYAKEGKAAPSGIAIDGIRHGHLVEFGTKHSSAKPFLWPALQSRTKAFTDRFAGFLRKKTEAAVRRRARKRRK